MSHDEYTPNSIAEPQTPRHSTWDAKVFQTPKSLAGDYNVDLFWTGSPLPDGRGHGGFLQTPGSANPNMAADASFPLHPESPLSREMNYGSRTKTRLTRADAPSQFPRTPPPTKHSADRRKRRSLAPAGPQDTPHRLWPSPGSDASPFGAGAGGGHFEMNFDAPASAPVMAPPDLFWDPESHGSHIPFDLAMGTETQDMRRHSFGWAGAPPPPPPATSMHIPTSNPHSNTHTHTHPHPSLTLTPTTTRKSAPRRLATSPAVRGVDPSMLSSTHSSRRRSRNSQLYQHQQDELAREQQQQQSRHSYLQPARPGLKRAVTDTSLPPPHSQQYLSRSHTQQSFASHPPLPAPQISFVVDASGRATVETTHDPQDPPSTSSASSPDDEDDEEGVYSANTSFAVPSWVHTGSRTKDRTRATVSPKRPLSAMSRGDASLELAKVRRPGYRN